jgi:tetratricopeptide (TPR) repeat protein
VGNHRHEGIAVGHLAALRHAAGSPPEAEQGYRESLALLQRARDVRAGGVVLALLGELLAGQDRRGEARRCFEEALSTHRQVGNERHEAGVLLRLAELLASSRQYEEAARQLEAALPLYRALGGPVGTARVHRRLGLVFLDIRELAEARRHLETAWRLVGNRTDSERGRVAQAHAQLAVLEGRVDDVARWLDVAGEVADPITLACQSWLARRAGASERAQSLAETVRASGDSRAAALIARE